MVDYREDVHAGCPTVLIEYEGQMVPPRAHGCAWMPVCVPHSQVRRSSSSKEARLQDAEQRAAALEKEMAQKEAAMAQLQAELEQERER